MKSISQKSGYLRGDIVMRRTSVLKKIKGGKTVKLDVVIDDGKIRDIVISGDFFVYPQEALEELENKLKGCSLNEAKSILKEYAGRVTVLGFTLDDVAELLEKAFKA